MIGEPTAAGDDVRFYRLQLTLEPGQLLGSAVAGLSGASRFGISGEAQWQVSPASGDLNSGGGSGRIIAEVRGPVALEFEMEGEGMEFYVDGLRVAEVDGGAVKVEHEIGDGEAQLLMWVTDGGEAVIRNLGR